MRKMPLSHAVLASLLWCAVIFAFVGVNFMKFESTAQALRDSRIQTALRELRRVIQNEMDKGASLPKIKVDDFLFRYSTEEGDTLSVMIFDLKTKKILFSTSGKNTGTNVSDEWLQKCTQSETTFSESVDDKETIGLPIFNPFLEKSGCLIAEYKTQTNAIVREEMISTAFHFTLRLASIGIFACFLVYFLALYSKKIFGQKKIRLWVSMGAGFLALVFIVQMNFLAMFRSFEKDMKNEIIAKTGIVAKQVKNVLEQVVQGGVPFKSINGLEPYLDMLRYKNKEILFILITDKTGRVLYESGVAAEAFDTDPRTGKVSLRKGYYNTAEPVNDLGEPQGWVQIGVNERFVREEVF